MKPVIENAYLVWVGRDSYSTKDDYLSEILSNGISKRLPNEGIAKSLLRPNTAIFVAHDDGHDSQCRHCQAVIDCPDCLSNHFHIAKQAQKLADFHRLFAPEAILARAGLQRTERVIRGRIDAKKAGIASCQTCKGKGKAKLGSGGEVRLKGGRTWSHREYVYWARQKRGFKAGDILSKVVCDKCGGRGLMPNGFVFGCYFVDSMAVVRREDSKGDEEDKGFCVVDPSAQPARKTGRMKPGVYAWASTTVGKKGALLGKALVDAKVVAEGGYIARGSFVEFCEPLALGEGYKRFRGVLGVALADMAAE